MTRPFRRFEILLPLRFNDGRTVPDELLAQTLIDLEQKFGAVSCETQSIRGLWSSEGQNYRDDLVRVFVDVSDTPDNRDFFVQFKDQLKVRFQQVDIWITTHPLEVL